ncbi:hypothetical protein XENOCAPTIV_023752 [Xenoophorus captivus]|uniref:Uncharacterized protein n=1 Tax=Xenoophorus captivus TaxID=1517983 RepID=A0ABV0S184_9TELE
MDIENTLHLHLNVSDLSNRDHILQFTPALSTLSDHVRYSIDNGNMEGFFKINQKEGVSYLHLSKKKVLPPGAYNLQISSVPLYRKKELDELEDQHDKDYLTGQLGDGHKMSLSIMSHNGVKYKRPSPKAKNNGNLPVEVKPCCFCRTSCRCCGMLRKLRKPKHAFLFFRLCFCPCSFGWRNCRYICNIKGGHDGNVGCLQYKTDHKRTILF